MAASRRCRCGAVATGTRVKGQWEPSPLCRRCLAMSRIGTVVEGLKAKAMAGVEMELELLRELESYVTTHIVLGRENIEGAEAILRKLDTLRELRGKGDD